MIRSNPYSLSTVIAYLVCTVMVIWSVTGKNAVADEPAPTTVIPNDSAVSPEEFNSAVEEDEEADSKAIYGSDDRVEVQQAAAGFRQAARSVAAIFASSDFDITFGDQRYLPRSQRLVDVGWCPDERFAQQTAAARCTGFLATPDTLVTSAHCVREDDNLYQDGLACGDLSVVFDYSVPASGLLDTQVSAARHFRCAAIIGRHLDPGGADWSVIRLDRPVPDREPLQLYPGSDIPADSTLSVIGHPLGLPAKLSGNGDIIEQGNDGYFVTNLDTYAGNSGSPVFMNDPVSDSLLVVGVLSRGDTDSESRLLSDGKTCQSSRLCGPSGCRGEHVTRSSVIPEFK